ncbi:MAG TPA: hypothetical protein VHZ02_01905 [Acidimicrobiales bacterium]|nr:hypothetical protein [Acidimicrobiales bacterium]
MDQYAQQLADAVDAALPAWVERCVALRAGQAGLAETPQMRQAAMRAGEAARQEVSTRLRALLELDIDAQTTTPLAILRQAVMYPTRVLQEAGVPAVSRDRFSESNFPSDVYDLTPAKFADVDPSLADPGLAWGASKAMAHLQRHRPR